MGWSIGKPVTRWYSADNGVGFGTTTQPVLAVADWPGSLPVAAPAPSFRAAVPVFDCPSLPVGPALPGHFRQRRPARDAAGNGRVESWQAGAQTDCQTRT